MFGPKRLPSILKGFHSTIADLEKLMAANHAKRTANANRMAKILEDSEKLHKESVAAERVSAKIQELVA